MDRRKGGCQQAATHKVNKPTRGVRAADLAEHGGYRGQFPRYSRLPCPVSGNIIVRRLVLCATTFGT